METVIESRTFEKGGFVYTVSRVMDEDSDISWLEDSSRYLDCTTEERATYTEQDRLRVLDYHHGHWYFVGVCCDIRRQTAANWADGGPIVGRASVWGIESDSEPGYFAEVEAEMIAEAEAEVENLRRVLCPPVAVRS